MLSCAASKYGFLRFGLLSSSPKFFVQTANSTIFSLPKQDFFINLHFAVICVKESTQIQFIRDPIQYRLEFRLLSLKLDFKNIHSPLQEFHLSEHLDCPLSLYKALYLCNPITLRLVLVRNRPIGRLA